MNPQTRVCQQKQQSRKANHCHSANLIANYSEQNIALRIVVVMFQWNLCVFVWLSQIKCHLASNIRSSICKVIFLFIPSQFWLRSSVVWIYLISKYFFFFTCFCEFSFTKSNVKEKKHFLIEYFIMASATLWICMFYMWIYKTRLVSCLRVKITLDRN